MTTALETVVALQDLWLAPITTPVCRPESHWISQAFHHTLRRDYVSGADLSSAAILLAQLPQWIADYNHFAPHSALGMRRPQEYRRAQEIASDWVSECLTNWGALQVTARRQGREFTRLSRVNWGTRGSLNSGIPSP